MDASILRKQVSVNSPTPKSNGHRNKRKTPSYIFNDKVLCHIGNILSFKLKRRAQHAPESQYVTHVQLKTSLGTRKENST